MTPSGAALAVATAIIDVAGLAMLAAALWITV